MRIANRFGGIPLGLWLPGGWLVLQFLLVMWSRGAVTPPTPIWAIVFFTVFQTAYLFPGMFASARGHPHRLFIWLVTLFLGWTGIGWIAAIIWAAVWGTSVPGAGTTTVRAVAPMSPGARPVLGGFLPQGLVPKSFLPPNLGRTAATASFLAPRLAPLADTAPEPAPSPAAFVPNTPAPKSLRVELAEKALAELEAQKVDGKISDADYAARRAELMAQL